MGRFSVNLCYVLLWGLASFMSSFEELFYVNLFSYVEPEMLLHSLKILFLWIVVFIGEFMYDYATYDKRTHIVDEELMILLFGLLVVLFVLFWAFLMIRSIYLIIAIYICVMYMKYVSLKIICPVIRLKAV